MKDVTLNPAMGRFLNMVNNNKGNPAKGTSANENYAREIMQLFTLGLTQMNMDGSPVLDGNGKPVPTYSQSTVSALAKAFTGWTYPPQPGAVTKGHNPTYYIGSMVPVQANHDTTQKELFPDFTLPAGETAEQDLNGAIHALFMQPSVPPFVSKLLIQHLTTSDPSPAYIGRVALVFADNGSGVRGDMQSVVYAILTDPEARAGDDASVAPSPAYGHMREPILFILNLLRGLDGVVSDASTVAKSFHMENRTVDVLRCGTAGLALLHQKVPPHWSCLPCPLYPLVLSSTFPPPSKPVYASSCAVPVGAAG
jgi:uncharacterized protein (DUF1800 family)